MADKVIITTLSASALEILRGNAGLIKGLEYYDSTNIILYIATDVDELIPIRSFWQRVATVIKAYTSGDSFLFGTDTNNTTIEADGTIKFNGAATVFDDVKFDALSLQKSGPGIDFNLVESTVDYLTTANQADYMIASPQFPHAMKAGSVVQPHIHFTQSQTGMPNWALQYRWQKNGGVKTTAWTALKCNTPAFTYPGTGSINQIAKTVSGITPPSGYNISDILQVRVIRDTANGLGLSYGSDPYGAVASVLSFDVHVELDSFGSHSEYTK